VRTQLFLRERSKLGIVRDAVGIPVKTPIGHEFRRAD
jgi:hypothetical protein